MIRTCVQSIRKSINVKELKTIEKELKKRIKTLEGLHPPPKVVKKANKNIFLL